MLKIGRVEAVKWHASCPASQPAHFPYSQRRTVPPRYPAGARLMPHGPRLSSASCTSRVAACAGMSLKPSVGTNRKSLPIALVSQTTSHRGPCLREDRPGHGPLASAELVPASRLPPVEDRLVRERGTHRRAARRARSPKGSVSGSLRPGRVGTRFAHIAVDVERGLSLPVGGVAQRPSVSRVPASVPAGATWAYREIRCKWHQLLSAVRGSRQQWLARRADAGV